MPVGSPRETSVRVRAFVGRVFRSSAPRSIEAEGNKREIFRSPLKTVSVLKRGTKMSTETVNIGLSSLGSLQFEAEIPDMVQFGHTQDYSNITITLADQRLLNSQLPLALVDGDLASTGRFVDNHHHN